MWYTVAWLPFCHRANTNRLPFTLTSIPTTISESPVNLKCMLLYYEYKLEYPKTYRNTGRHNIMKTPQRRPQLVSGFKPRIRFLMLTPAATAPSYHCFFYFILSLHIGSRSQHLWGICDNREKEKQRETSMPFQAPSQGLLECWWEPGVWGNVLSPIPTEAHRPIGPRLIICNFHSLLRVGL